MRKNLLYCFLLLVSLPVWSQALDQLGLKKGVSMSGSVNASTTVYKANGIESRRDPLAWYLNGNININMFGYAMPFSFSYSNQGRNYSQPFNQFRFAPSYKWARAYFGSTSMNFSNYTLAGHMFNGAGVELSPGKWRVSAMYGTLLKAVPFDVKSPETYNRAAFERKGKGLKVGYENNANVYAVSLFHAKDDASSIPYIPDDATISPKENIAVAVNVRQHITTHLFADVEYSVSALNRDIRSEKNAFDSSRETFNLRYFDAIQAGIGYTGGFYSVQLRYERVAPDYITLGAYNVVNDMRNITVAPTLQLFGGKVNISANAGMQVNNLDDSKTSDAKRIVANVNTGINPDEHWTLNAGYSNFSNYTRVRPLIDPYFNNPMDTLDYYQVNNSYNGMLMYRVGDQNRQQAVTLNASYQYASDKSNAADAVENLSKFFTSNISYSYHLPPKALSMTGSVNYYSNTATGLNTTFLGPSVNVNKQFFDKMFRTGVTATYNVSQASSSVAGVSNVSYSTLFNTGLNVNYSPKGKPSVAAAHKITHNIGASVMWLLRGAAASQPGYNELTSSINYTYSF